MLNLLQIIIFISVSSSVLAGSLYEDQVEPSLLVKQRKYTSEKIFNMIKAAKVNNDLCSVNFESDGYYFAIIKGEHSFGFTNNVLIGKKRHRSRYECILISDETLLECEQRLPRESNSIFQQSDIYVRLTINLDEKGNAVSMHGVKSRKYSVAGHVLPNLLERTITEFKCDIQPPAVIKDTAVADKVRNTDSNTNLPNSEENQGSTSTAK